jgi:hypothetical protein
MQGGYTMKTIAKHLVPNAGTLIIVGLLFLVQSVGALPGATSAEPLAPSQTLISYQGTLTDSSGNPINGTVSMEFSLYDAATGGNRMWGPETQTVQVSGGMFHVLLGSVTPIDLAGVTAARYLSIEVNGEALSPRETLTSVPFAIEASRVSAPLNVQGNISSSGSSGGQISALNPNNQSAAVHLGWLNDVARIRVGGSGAGASNGLDIQSVGNVSLLRIFGNGNLRIKGSVTCGALTEANLQTSEELAADRIDRFSEGDVLCWSAQVQRLEKCSAANDPLVQAVADGGGRPIVIGAEVVKVIGPVRAGDYLVTSAVPGYAMASPNPKFGIVIAQALEELDEERGLIKAMIRKM